MVDVGAYVILVVVLISAAVDDLRTGKVHNVLTLPAIAVGLVFWLIAGLAGTETGIASSAIGVAAAAIPFGVLFLMGGLGGGDVKLMAAVGAISASWQCVLATAVYALLIGMVLALFLMVRHGIVKQTARRLLQAALLGAARVKPIPNPDTPKVPFALAVAVGGLVAGAETLLGWRTPWSWLGP